MRPLPNNVIESASALRIWSFCKTTGAGSAKLWRQPGSPNTMFGISSSGRNRVRCTFQSKPMCMLLLCGNCSVYQESLMKGMFLGENQVMRGPSAAEGDVSLFRCLGESRETGNVSLSHCVRGRCPVSSLPHAAVLSHSVSVGVGRRARHGGARRGAEPLVSMAWLRHRAPRASLHGHPNESNAPCSQLSTPPRGRRRPWRSRPRRRTRRSRCYRSSTLYQIHQHSVPCTNNLAEAGARGVAGRGRGRRDSDDRAGDGVLTPWR